MLSADYGLHHVQQAREKQPVYDEDSVCGEENSQLARGARQCHRHRATPKLRHCRLERGQRLEQEVRVGERFVCQVRRVHKGTRQADERRTERDQGKEEQGAHKETGLRVDQRKVH